MAFVGLTGCRQSNPDWHGPVSTTSTTSADTALTGESGEAPNTDDGTGGMGLGLPCSLGDCSAVPGAECCQAAQCLETCMVPCMAVEDCPLAEMGCEHGYCLFPCSDDDADCAQWPGYTCQHMGMYCESDV